MSDVISRIDELIDEQLESGEPTNGYDYGDPDYPRCGHCGRHWHGLPITERIAAMYQWGAYDPGYRLADDDSPVLCEGLRLHWAATITRSRIRLLPPPRRPDQLHRRRR